MLGGAEHIAAEPIEAISVQKLNPRRTGAVEALVDATAYSLSVRNKPTRDPRVAEQIVTRWSK